MPKGKYVNSTGKKYNSLTVLSETKKNNKIYCECLCDCGNIKLVRKGYVTKGLQKNCGCTKSLIGKRFGKLTVLSDTNLKNKNGRKIYLCLCDCGKTKQIVSDYLLKGTRSCGCLLHQEKYDNLIGKRFGKLLVLKEVEKTFQSQRQFLCLCDCGNEKIIPGSNLIHGQSTSCGCNKGYVENTKINLIKRKEAYPNSKSGIKGVWQDNKGYWHAMITVCKKRIFFYGGLGENGKIKCVRWRKEMVEKYHNPLIKKYEEKNFMR